MIFPFLSIPLWYLNFFNVYCFCEGNRNDSNNNSKPKYRPKEGREVLECHPDKGYPSFDHNLVTVRKIFLIESLPQYVLVVFKSSTCINFFKFPFIYLATSGLSCSTRDLLVRGLSSGGVRA